MTEEQREAKRAAQAEKEALAKAIDSSIVFHGVDMTPKWEELSRTLIPRQINRKAEATIVDNNPKKHRKYKLTVRFLNTTKDITGSDSRGGGVAGASGNIALASGRSRTKIKTITTIEAIATLAGSEGKTLWKWSGYSEDEDDDDAVEKIGDKMADELSEAGYLDAKRYISTNAGLK